MIKLNCLIKGNLFYTLYIHPEKLLMSGNTRILKFGLKHTKHRHSEVLAYRPRKSHLPFSGNNVTVFILT